MSERALSARLREATQSLHRVAEASGIMPALLAGRVERREYCRLLRNLHALYVALEDALDRNARSPLVAPVRMPELFRASALAADLGDLHGPGWRAQPLADAMRGYVAHIGALAEDRPGLLAAHAYVRYLGDLSGGQILRNVVGAALGLADRAGVAFYCFGDGDAAALKARFRAGLDALPVGDAAADAIVAEARDAFARHVRLFEELDGRPVVGR
jgi:heme oxygenase